MLAGGRRHQAQGELTQKVYHYFGPVAEILRCKLSEPNTSIVPKERTVPHSSKCTLNRERQAQRGHVFRNENSRCSRRLMSIEMTGKDKTIEAIQMTDIQSTYQGILCMVS